MMVTLGARCEASSLSEVKLSLRCENLNRVATCLPCIMIITSFRHFSFAAGLAFTFREVVNELAC